MDLASKDSDTGMDYNSKESEDSEPDRPLYGRHVSSTGAACICEDTYY